jgi:hypothetical protein
VPHPVSLNSQGCACDGCAYIGELAADSCADAAGLVLHRRAHIAPTLRAQQPLRASTAPHVAGCTSVPHQGRVWSAGYPQYGQLGDGDDHMYNAKECECRPARSAILLRAA